MHSSIEPARFFGICRRKNVSNALSFVFYRILQCCLASVCGALGRPSQPESQLLVSRRSWLPWDDECHNVVVFGLLYQGIVS
jgi:hypothetical protein